MKKTRPMTVNSNQVAATIMEHPEQSVNMEVKQTHYTKANRAKPRKAK
ncbi:hypothetical protein JMN32_11660 [Fulvivirga sp. 29W222]|uniref:Uncharacterized protein n=1 Tax=Fulvivirga marina TaxID=2494733 RepID=A0A937FZ05_9BACT|nr:hypothetical protein [Fulvivirga marina]MBL6446970.1 hypothetical protein [Fulvivirga marina]